MKNKSKDIFSNTLFDLLYTFPFNEITVKMIIEKSNLSHATFYRCFKDKYDLLIYLFHHKITDEFFKEESGTSYFEITKISIFYSNKNKVFFKNVLNDTNNTFIKLLKHRYLQFMSKRMPKLTHQQLDLLKLYINGNLYTCMEWFMNDKHYSVDYMTNIFKMAMPEALKEIFKEI